MPDVSSKLKGPLRQGFRSDLTFAAKTRKCEKSYPKYRMNMFSRLKFSVDLKSKVRNTKF